MEKINFDFIKEEKEFIRELETGKYSIKSIPNSARDFRDVENRDLDIFDNYIKSDFFKILNDEASGNGEPDS
jgi:hypothetical protein